MFRARLFDTDGVREIFFLKKFNFEKNLADNKSMKNDPACKAKNYIVWMLRVNSFIERISEK